MALYYGCKLTIPLHTNLKEMDHPQHKCTMVTTNNITAQGLTMGTMTPKASKSIYQRFHWLKSHHAQCLFLYLGNAASITEPTMPANIIRPNTNKQFGPSTSKTHYNPE
jgi:hypothetical protein